MGALVEMAKAIGRGEKPGINTKPDKQFLEKLKRGRDRMAEDAPTNNQCLRFWRGDSYVYVNGENYLVKQSTVTNGDGTGKQPHRIRQKRNLLLPVVARKVSGAVQRTPAYSVTPATTDPEDIAAAKLADRVALAGYDQWRIRDYTKDVVTYALVTDGGGFCWPYWDSSVGPYVEDDEGIQVGIGDVRLRVFGPNEVYWEPGLKFRDSPWHAVEQARSMESVMGMDGYIGGTLRPDANASDIHEAKKGDNHLVMVTEYLERPTPQNPSGTWMVLANDRIICEPRDYPCQDGKGNVIDEPVLHDLAFIADPDGDRNMGLVNQLIDAIRTYQDCTNKQLEWKNLCLMPQWVTTPGNWRGKRTDAPGAVFTLNSLAQDHFRQLDVPAVPGDLQAIKEEAKSDISIISADNEIPNQVESGKGIQAIIESNRDVWAEFYGNVAQFHSRLMRHCLYLVQKHYQGDRLMQYRGRMGWEPVGDFTGADIRGQCDVRVAVDSIIPRTREALEQQVMNIAQMFPGWLSPEVTIRALDTGHLETLIRGYEVDLERAHRVIQKIKAGPETLFAVPDRPGIEEGFPVPGWMPRKFDNIAIQKQEFEDWMKSHDYEEMPAEMQEAANLYYDGLLWLEAQAQAQAVMAQNAMAEEAGMSNAASPAAQGGGQAKPMPSLPAAGGKPQQA